MSDFEKAAKEYFDQGYNCAQGVLMIHGPKLGLDAENAARVGAAFGGGICRSGNTCGAVAGALMVLGLKYGNTKPDDKRAKERTYVRSRKFIQAFEEEFGAIMCRDILGVDLGQEGGLEYAREHKLFEQACPKFVGAAARILEGMLYPPK